MTSEINIKISQEEWKQFTTSEKYVSNRVSKGQSRKTFLSPFFHHLNQKLQAIGIIYINNLYINYLFKIKV